MSKPKTTAKKAAPPGTTSITFRIPRAMRKELGAMAKREDLTVSQILRRHFSAILPSLPAAARKEKA